MLDLEDLYSLLESYDAYNPKTAVGKARMEFWEKFLLERRAILGKKALDLACGGGVLSIVLAKLGLEVTAVDIQEKMINFGVEFAREMGYNIRFLIGDIRKIDLLEKFDSIFLVGNSIIHFNISDMEKIVLVVKKHLRKGGIFVVEYADEVWEIFNRCRDKLAHTSAKILDVVYEPDKGCISYLVEKKKLRDDLIEVEKYNYYIWAPWILEKILAWNDFEKIERFFWKNNTFIDIYRYQ